MRIGFLIVIGGIPTEIARKDIHFLCDIISARAQEIDPLLCGIISESLGILTLERKNQSPHVACVIINLTLDMREIDHDTFIREYFRFDLNIRNAKVKYLNKALGRPADKDVLSFGEDTDQRVLDAAEAEFEEAADLETILNSGDILSRERGIDDLMWEKISDLTTFNYFDIDAVLGFITKLNIVARWYKLDEQTGREMFKKLVDEVRGTFKGVEYNG